MRTLEKKKGKYLPMMKPEDLQPPEEDLTDGLPRKSTEPSTTPYESVVPVSLSALEIDIVSCLLFQSYPKS